MSEEELRSLYDEVGMEASSALKTVRELDDAGRRLDSRILDYSTTEGSEYRMSEAKLERLDKMMRDHILNLPADTPSRPKNWETEEASYRGPTSFGNPNEPDNENDSQSFFFDANRP